MKKFVSIIVLMLVSSLAQAAGVTLAWSYDFSVDPGCSTTTTTNCVDHFEVFDLTGGSRVLLQSVVAPVGAITLQNNISSTFTMGPPYKPRVLNVIAVGKDDTGLRIESSPAAVTFSVKPSTVQTLTFTVK